MVINTSSIFKQSNENIFNMLQVDNYYEINLGSIFLDYIKASSNSLSKGLRNIVKIELSDQFYSIKFWIMISLQTMVDSYLS